MALILPVMQMIPLPIFVDRLFLKLQFLKDLHAFFISNTFISNARLKLAQNQANAKQHPETEVLLFEKYSHSSSTLSSKNSRTYSKK